MLKPVYKSAFKIIKKLPLWRSWTRLFSVQMEDFDENKLPETLQKRKPSEPKPEDCCGDGCKVCVYDLYDQEMKIWKNECYLFLGYDVVQIPQSTEIDWISPLSYTLCTLKKIKEITSNCNLYYFMLPKDTKIEMKPGEHLVLRGEVKNDVITRQYTPLSSRDNSFNVLIKIYERGLMSEFVSRWKEGCQVEWRGPFGEFLYTRNAHTKLVLVAAGTGIAPMVQVIQAILEDEMDDTRIHLFFSCRFYDEILMKDLLNEWKQFWNFKVTYFLSQEKDYSKAKYGENVVYNRLCEATLQTELTDQAKTRVLICGTKDFDNALKKHLKALNFPEENVHIF